MNAPRLIVLSGPKNCGKSNTGRALKRIFDKLSPPRPALFYDVDKEIEAKAGKSVRELYQEGKEVFYEVEAAALSSILSETRGVGGAVIIALGGGVCDNEAAYGLLERGVREKEMIIVYLEIGVECAWKRIKDGARRKGGLPVFLRGRNLRGMSAEEKHREIHTRRAALYKKLASITVECEGKDSSVIAGEIMSVLGMVDKPSLP